MRFDLVQLTPFLFLKGKVQTEKKAKRETLNQVGTLDMTFRNVFEGKLNADNGTFPVLFRGCPRLDASDAAGFFTIGVKEAKGVTPPPTD